MIICVLTVYGSQESGEADLNPKVLGCFGLVCFFFFPQKKANAFAGNKENQYLGRKIINENRKKLIPMLFITMLKKKLLFNLRNTFPALGSKGSNLV